VDFQFGYIFAAYNFAIVRIVLFVKQIQSFLHIGNAYAATALVLMGLWEIGI
jgi:hypothetical protein